MDHADQRDVVVVVCEGVVLPDLTGSVQVFTGAGGYRIRLASLDGRPVRTDTGIVLGADSALSDVDSPVDTLVVPGPTPDLLEGFPPALIAEVRRLSAGSAPAPAGSPRSVPGLSCWRRRVCWRVGRRPRTGRCAPS